MPQTITFIFLFLFCFVHEQISQTEYIEDVQKPMTHPPNMPVWAILIGILIPIAGWIFLFVYMVTVFNRKLGHFPEIACEAFNAKYSESRGVRLSYGSSRIRVAVKRPGVAIPGVELFVPSKESLKVIRSYQDGSYFSETGPTSYGTGDENNTTPGTMPSLSSDPSAPLLVV